jgi:hypothetical protein
MRRQEMKYPKSVAAAKKIVETALVFAEAVERDVRAGGNLHKICHELNEHRDGAPYNVYQLSCLRHALEYRNPKCRQFMEKHGILDNPDPLDAFFKSRDKSEELWKAGVPLHLPPWQRKAMWLKRHSD